MQSRVAVDSRPAVAVAVAAPPTGVVLTGDDAHDDSNSSTWSWESSSGSGELERADWAGPGGVSSFSDFRIENRDHSSLHVGPVNNFHGPVTVVLQDQDPHSTRGSPPSLTPGKEDELVLSASFLRPDNGLSSAASPTPVQPLGHAGRDKWPPVRWLVVATVCTVCAGVAVGLAVALTATTLTEETTTTTERTLYPGLVFVSRGDWNARPPRSSAATPLPRRVDGLAFHHSKTEPCFEKAECSRQVLALQSDHQTLLDDIMYNFLVGGDGRVYEGRGWVVGQHLPGWDEMMLGVCLIGRFDDVCPSEAQRATVQLFIEYAEQMGRLFGTSSLVGACQLTEKPMKPGPGRCFLEDLKTWPQFWNDTVRNSSCDVGV